MLLSHTCWASPAQACQPTLTVKCGYRCGSAVHQRYTPLTALHVCWSPEVLVRMQGMAMRITATFRHQTAVS
jgi:hypothetical protein